MMARSVFASWLPRLRTGTIAILATAMFAGLVALVVAGYKLSVRWSTGAVELSPAASVTRSQP